MFGLLRVEATGNETLQTATEHETFTAPLQHEENPMFRQMLHTLAPSVSGKVARSARPNRRRLTRQLRLEPLQKRELFAVLAGESLVNSTTALDQSDAATAAAPDGRSVVVWTHQYSSSDTDIYAQRFDRSGNKVGGEIRVATSSRRESQPDVSMDSVGDFVVTWRDHVTSSNSDIKAQRFSSAGALRGSVITVASSNKNEYSPSIASAANGDFVIAWTRDWTSSDQDVQARMFRDNGTAIAAAFTVAGSGTFDEFYPDVARSPDGRFAISYQTDAGNGDVIVKRYSSTGTTVGTHSIATGSAEQWNPRVSMDNSGNTMVVWQEKVGNDFDIKARRVASNGSLNNVINVRGSFDQETMPDVAMKRDGSAFVVTHYNVNQRTTNATELTTSGTVRRTDVLANNARWEATAIAFGDGSDYRVAYGRVVGNQGENIYLRRGRLS